MVRPLSLRFRLFFIVVSLVATTGLSGSVIFWYTYRLDALSQHILQVEVAAFQVVSSWKDALVNQKGFVSYYFIDGQEKWLIQLRRYRQRFVFHSKQARQIPHTSQEKQALARIERQYRRYTQQKDATIQLYRTGKRQAGRQQHQQARLEFFRLLHFFKNYQDLISGRIRRSWRESHRQAGRLRLIAVGAVSLSLFLGLLLSFVLFQQILEPIRRLTHETRPSFEEFLAPNEVVTLSRQVHHLLEDADHTRHALQWSRKRLIDSEKMALLGKLAAEMAHSIRNPLTSIKMRLFSLEKHLQLAPVQQEDLKVVSEEMRRLDAIVNNFLDFSRPLPLQKKEIDLWDLIEAAVDLLQKRLELHGIAVEVVPSAPLPSLEADPVQFKEVLVNLLVNACEAMDQGGSLSISVEDGLAENLGRAVLIRLCDTGPGIREEIQEQVFEPFFSTKEGGTGLGLSMALQIIEEHGGQLTLYSTPGKGTTFLISLPVQEEGG